jgi:hypothetical protein
VKLLAIGKDDETPLANGPSDPKHSGQDKNGHKQLLQRTYS